MSKTLKLVIAAVALVVAIPGGTFVYFHFISSDAPAPLTLNTNTASDSSTTTTSTATVGAVVAVSGDVNGSWKPTTASQVGYRVNEVAFGQSKAAVGRTNQMTGTLVVDGSTVKSVEVVADMTTVTSDQSRRDNQFKGRIMNVAQYPTATFKLTNPFALPSVPSDSTPVTAKVTGDLTLHGTTKSVTIDINAKRQGATIVVNGSIPVTFADYNIPNPTFGPVSTQDHGVLEFLVTFAKG